MIASAITQLGIHKDIDIEKLGKAARSGGLITAALATVYLAYAISHTKQGLKMVPYWNPVSGSTNEFQNDPSAFSTKWGDKYGNFKAMLYGREMIILSGESVKKVFNDPKFSFLEAIEDIFNTRLLANCGKKNDINIQQIRVFVKRDIVDKLELYTPRVMRQLEIGAREIIGESGESTVPHLYMLLQNMVARASAAIFCGEEICQNEELIDSFKNIVIDIGSQLKRNVLLDRFAPIKRFYMWYIGKTSSTVRRHRQQLRDAIAPLVHEREEKRARCSKEEWAKIRPQDVLQDVLEGQPCPPHIDQLSYLVNWLTQLIFAAVHTTSENSTIVLYRICSHKGLVERLREEQNEVLARLNKDSFDRSVIREFKLLDSVIREGMRLRNDHIVLDHKYLGDEPYTFEDGMQVKKGGVVSINVYHNHHNEEMQGSYGYDLGTFVPDRYIDADKMHSSTSMGPDHLVFGMGRHGCPGRELAIQEMKTAISYIVQNYDLTPQSDIIFPSGDGNRLPFGQVIFKKRTV